MLDFPVRRTVPSLDDIYANEAQHFPNSIQKFHFLKEKYNHLNPTDQELFEKFGQGPVVTLPYDAIHRAFEAQARQRPDALAADHLGDAISYGELNRQANRLAAVLAQHGVSNGDAVSLFVRRSVPMLVGIMASLKTGACYVPQDVKVAPEPQMRHVATVTQSKVILTLSEFAHLVPVVEGTTIIKIDELIKQPISKQQDAEFVPDAPIQPDDRCFVLFTSGTTGKPNGVQVTHRNVCNILLTEPGNMMMGPGKKVAQILSISFDMAAWETLGCLAHGSTLIVRGRDFTAAAAQADVIISTPSILSTIDADQCRNVQAVAVAGEPCPRALADKWSEFATFYNSCGPTETTIVNTMEPHYASKESLTIGQPTPNNTVYVLDENLKPLPIGEVGEMWAGGDCVTAGYLGNLELTNERYVDDPFLPGRKMFRTRDLGRWTPEGELEHFGRTDDQVKIRGFRVELDSVSAALEAVPHAKRCTTMKFDSRNLVAFVSPANVDIEAAHQSVLDTLPYYCDPLFILAYDELPLTSRGKIDKRRLMDDAIAHAEKNQLAE
ncbi:MAG: amino acid adenylation domain-containing protein [Chloroflexota bacterium]